MILALMFFFFALVCVVCAIVLGAVGWYIHRKAAWLTLPLSRIGKLRPGPRKVRGQIAAFDEVLHSPMTNQKCVYYRLRVYEQGMKSRPTDVLRGVLRGPAAFHGGFFVYSFGDSFASSRDPANERSEYSWHNVVDEVESVPFCIEDGTGSVEVDVRGATVSPKTKARMATSMHEPVLALSPLTERLREDHGLEAVDERGQFKTLRFEEEVLLIGAEATVLGSVESSEDRALCFRMDDEAL
ncbi:MAG: GIDE domain-containing protein [Gemmataceae bacterium]